MMMEEELRIISSATSTTPPPVVDKYEQQHKSDKNNTTRIMASIATITIDDIIENALKINTIGGYTHLLDYLKNNPNKTREITRID